MKRVAACLVAVLALGLSRTGFAEEISEDRRAELESARALVERGLAALADGNADEAVDLLQQSRAAAPGAAVPTYDHAVALARAGRMDDALVAYKDALAMAPSDVRAAVSARARHNLSGLQLDLARGAVDMLTTPGALEQAVRAQPGPDGKPMAEGMADTLALQMRRKIVDEGLTAAKEAVSILRDTVRDDPSASDAVRNLVLAQRARRALEQELENQQQTEQDEKGDQDDGEEEDSEEGEQGDQGQPDDQGDDQEDTNAGQDDQQDGEEQSGDDGDSTESEDSSAQAQQGEPRDVGKEEAERMLERLLDAASLKARQVEEMKAARLRRGKVEKDW